MNRSEFADLLGVSPPAVANWEQAHGTLTLRQRSAQALNRAARLTRDQAWAKLKR
jgi:DNA-binding transcriptional regulator YiaG